MSITSVIIYQLLGFLVLATHLSSCTHIFDPHRVNQANDAQAGLAVVGPTHKEEEEGTGGAPDSWTIWARDKMTEGLGHRYENAKMAARQMKEVVDDIAEKTKVSVIGSGAAKITSDKAKEAKDEKITSNSHKEKEAEGDKKITSHAHKDKEAKDDHLNEKSTSHSHKDKDAKDDRLNEKITSHSPKDKKAKEESKHEAKIAKEKAKHEAKIFKEKAKQEAKKAEHDFKEKEKQAKHAAAHNKHTNGKAYESGHANSGGPKEKSSHVAGDMRAEMGNKAPDL